MRSSISKIKSPAQLKRILAAARKKKLEIVFTNGCFDLLHRGHVSYLERARKAGDLLVVALNSDASVKRLKGSDRPLNALEDRLMVMAAVESVDYVTWFTEDTPLKLIRELRPTVLVKGGDWKPDQIVGGSDVRSWGGKVRSLRFVEGRSTTRTIEKIRKSR
ncbi:MAG: ADP-heptose synthase [Bdellovibrionales bacterium GWB1_55_8]|nr:MAG: ADP-heptose synthase [Bdellovibrionales bacterium GWB1_55_8]